jgi:hypothetical protein
VTRGAELAGGVVVAGRSVAKVPYDPVAQLLYRQISVRPSVILRDIALCEAGTVPVTRLYARRNTQ